MPQSAHDRAAELHNFAAHAHAAAATAHGKGEYLTAHELTKQAHEHSVNAHRLAEELASENVARPLMTEPEITAFGAADFLAKSGLGRRIVHLKPEHVFFWQGSRPTPFSIFRRVARS